MSGLNGMLDGLILNRTPHIHIYNEIKPNDKQPVHFFDEISANLNVIHSIKPKQTQLKIHNAQPIINYLKSDKKVKAVLPQVKSQVFYVAGSTELNGIVTGIKAKEVGLIDEIGDLEDTIALVKKDLNLKGEPKIITHKRRVSFFSLLENVIPYTQLDLLKSLKPLTIEYLMLP